MKIYLLTLLIGFTFFMSCNGIHSGGGPLHNGPFFRTEWQDFASRTASSPTPLKSNLQKTNIHFSSSKIVENTTERLNDSQPQNHFGSNDVQHVLEKSGYSNCFPKNADVLKMVKVAKQKNAFEAGFSPSIGDFILFHNQYDRNNNGTSDDWFTGVAIVIDSKHNKYLAVTRVGKGIKKIIISPGGPMVHTYKDETVNSFVKVPSPHDPKDAQYLSGQLYAGYINSEQLVNHCQVK